jgi:copper chaperone CopZ
VVLAWTLAALPAVADDHVKHQVTGLFSKDRVEDLRETLKKLPKITLVSVDFENAEAVFAYTPSQAFPGAKPDQVVKQFDNLLRSASFSTFGIKPLRTIARDKLKLIEIDVAGLDCKGCCLGAYEAIYKLDGVEKATASFKEGRVTALVDPAKIDRTRLEAALKKKGAELKQP